MQYVGLQEQINKNNFKSILLLISFPMLIFVAVFAVVAIGSIDQEKHVHWDIAAEGFIKTIPFVIIGVGIWFMIAFLGEHLHD